VFGDIISGFNKGFPSELEISGEKIVRKSGNVARILILHFDNMMGFLNTVVELGKGAAREKCLYVARIFLRAKPAE